MSVWIGIAVCFAASLATEVEGDKKNPHFRITVVDEATGRGVPLVELTTVHDIRYYTDSAGVVAFHEPGLMDQTVFFQVASHGYEFPADGFGYRGVRLKTTPGGQATLRIRRLQIAERLYRVTGGGIYRDSDLLGDAVPLDQPLLNAQVSGSDSVVNAVYRGKIYWFWGDTNRPAYILGNFHVPGATTPLPGTDGLDPAKGLPLDYFLDSNGFAKETCRMEGEGPTWMDAVTVVPDANGRERMLARYVKVKKPMVIYRQGWAEFNDERNQFEHRVDLPLDGFVASGCHPVFVPHGDQQYVYYGHPFLTMRVKASAESVLDLSQYETFTCLTGGETNTAEAGVDRHPDGRLRFSWKRNALPLSGDVLQQFVRDGKVTPDEARPELRDIETGKIIRPHGGSIYWNPYRQRWVLILLEYLGTSVLGEIWYAEADTPMGPWKLARKVVTHDKYSFYNPKQHPMLDEQGGRIIYFEGTYTHTFSGNQQTTPRYNYNQIMYRLDLADPRLALPVAVYRVPEPQGGHRYATAVDRADRDAGHPVVCFALDREVEGCVPVFDKGDSKGARLVVKGDGQPVFFGLPVDAEDASGLTEVLLEYVDEGVVRYGIGELPEGAERVKAVCRVWRHG